MGFFSVSNINKVFESTQALTNVSLSVDKGSIFGLLGPNGAGKTTLIRIINQITAPDSGEVILEGRRMTSQDVEKIGYLPEERGLYRKMKIGDQALYLAQLKGMSRHDALKALKYWFEKFEISGWWDKKIEELSKGMQQKVQFVTTVVHKPQLLIFDEPFTGFDPINANLIKQEILELRDKGATILFSTHNMGTVEDLCDHIALINKSVKILDGAVSDVKDKFKTNIFEVNYTGDFGIVESALGHAYSILEHKENKPENMVKIQHLNGEGSNDLLRILLNVAEIKSFREIVPNMNDIFIRVVESSNAEKE
jgi:ABC-2 type transport system ATP-binding protein